MEQVHRTVRLPPALQCMKARMGTVVVDLEHSRLLDQRMIHTVQGARLGRMVEDMGLVTGTLVVLEADSLLVDGATEAFRLRRILAGRYVRSLRREGLYYVHSFTCPHVLIPSSQMPLW